MSNKTPLHNAICERVTNGTGTWLDLVVCNAYDNETDETLESAARQLAALEKVAELAPRALGFVQYLAEHIDADNDEIELAESLASALAELEEAKK